jgi:hypothetical protein
MTFQARPNRQPLAPLTSGKPCDWCECADCQGTTDAHDLERASHRLADGSRMCDICWLYPPCGTSDDCETFRTTGQCEHRPTLADGAKWEDFTTLVLT